MNLVKPSIESWLNQVIVPQKQTRGNAILLLLNEIYGKICY